MKDRSSFEVQVLQDKRWVLQQIVGDEAAAVAFADQLVGKSNHTAVRVVRDFKRADGLHAETVVVEKASTPTKADINIVPVADAPNCTEWQQAYDLPARMVMGRVFRKYLDEIEITPTELLHSAREMKRLADKDRLLMSAVDQVSTLQAPGGGDAAKERRDFLHKGWDQAYARVNRVGPVRIPKETSLKALRAAAGGGEQAEFQFQMRVVMAGQLLDLKGWLAKLDRVLAWSADEDAGSVAVLLDGIIADLLLPASSLQDLLGFQNNLGTALCRMLDLAFGQAEGDKSGESFVALNKLFAANRLPQSREAILTRISRELRSANPLSRHEPSREYEVYTQLLGKLVTYQDVIGGPVMADALTQRYIRFHNMGGTSGLVNAINDVANVLADRCRMTLYLMSLLETPRIVETCGPMILRKLGEPTLETPSIRDWTPARMPPPEKMSALTRCYKLIKASPALEEGLKTKLADVVDSVLAKYLQDEEVIEKIDKPSDPLAFRSLRLIKFCASGALIQGKSLALAHKRVLDHLRQPQFEEKFLASIPDKTQAEAHLREFHRLLMQVGVKN